MKEGVANDRPNRGASECSVHEGHAHLPRLERPFDRGLLQKVRTLSECRWGSKTLLVRSTGLLGPGVPELFSLTRMPKATSRRTLEEAHMALTVQARCGDGAHFVKTFGIWQDGDYIHVASEAFQLDDVLTWSHRRGACGEVVARRLARQLLAPLLTLHECDFVHLACRLESWRVVAGGVLKLELGAVAGCTSTGRAAAVAKGEGDATTCMQQRLQEWASDQGHNPYTPPELMQDAVHLADEVDLRKVNVFQVGVAVFALLTGQYPADGARPLNLSACKVPLSNECHDFLQQLLAPRPEERPSVRDALSHPWLWG